MERRKQEPKKSNSVKFRPIISLLIGLSLFTVILIVTMLNAAHTSGLGNLNEGSLPGDGSITASPAASYDSEVLGVIKEIDTENQRITLFDVMNQEDVTLTYTGGSDVKDKYEQAVTMDQMSVGSMVDAGYVKENSKLMKMQLSNKAWEYTGVGNLSINQTDRIMKVADTKYKYTDNILIFDGLNQVTVDDLAEQDVVTLWGYEETVCAITIEQGHGTVRLADYDAFLGGNVTVGYEAMQQITDDTVITVREGNFNLTAENGDYSATKNVTVTRDQETVVSLAGLGPAAVKKGLVTFEIAPFGADLFVDGELTSYANPLELSYGGHEIKASLGGYTTFAGTLNVDEAGKTIKIDLPEADSNKDASASVTGSTTSENGTSGTTDWITGDTGATTDAALPTPKPDSSEDKVYDEAHVIYVQNPIGASVYIDGEFMGISPGSFKKILGSHVITFIKEGYVTKSYTIEVNDDGLDTYFSLPDLEKSK